MSIRPITLYLEKREEIFHLLSQLTTAVTLNETRLKNIIYSLPSNHNIYLYFKDNKIVGMITLLIEQKLIHNGATVAHIEDLVVDKDYLKQGIATELMQHCLSQLRTDTCYKVILDCKSEMVPFYEKLGFKETNVQMSRYF
jgi:glucosamine-phosphate N-acetyltransferase